ncbi:MAG: hypothetical protein R3F54_28520 [Alphaproteobacteria bacterium]
MSESLSLSEKLRRIFIFFVIIYVTIAPFLLPAASATLAIVGIIAVFFLLNFEKLSKLKLGPLEAILREAQDNLKETRSLALRLAEINLEILIGGCFGFQDGLKTRRRFEIHDRIIDSLRQLDIPEIDILDAEKHWRRGINFMFMNQIIHVFEMRTKKNQINTKDLQGGERRKISKSIHEMADLKSWTAPTLQQIRQKITESIFEISFEVESMINNYESFLSSGKINAQDDFLKFYDE